MRLRRAHLISWCQSRWFWTGELSLPQKHVDTIVEYTEKIALELKVVGLMNIQYAIADDRVYILEANPRASRTVPLVSKICNVSMARIAAGLMMGGDLASLKLERKEVVTEL